MNLSSSSSISANYEIKESYTDYFDPRFPKSLFVILIVFGVCGNLLSLVVFLSSTMKNNSIFTYLAYLSVVDLFVIVFGLGDLILISYFGFIIRNYSIVLCRLHTFATYFFTHLSSFILASVSLDRAIALNLSKFARFYCLPRTAHFVVFIDGLIVLAINFHTLVFLGTFEHALDQSNGTSYRLSCASKDGSIYDRFLEPYFEWIDLMSYAIAPFLVMVVCTFFIVRVVFKSYNRSKRMSNVSFENEITNHGPPLVPGGPPSQCIRRSKSRSSSRKKNISYTLILLNIIFFVLVSPLLFLMTFLSGIENIREFKFLINTVYILAYANHCLNFIFYGLSSPPYRKAVKVLFKIK